MEDITKDFLIKKGFREDFENIFTYSNKEYTIDIIYSEIPFFPNRHWKIIIFSSTRYMMGYISVQTKEQFKKVIEICDVDLNSKE